MLNTGYKSNQNKMKCSCENILPNHTICTLNDPKTEKKLKHENAVETDYDYWTYSISNKYKTSTISLKINTHSIHTLHIFIDV